ncbi:hypothetical protein DEU56DRAFT_851000 [Suillus clintonianus]|uniref:uncharacterized protein n=1 Tax=Suillus clintonianus TaxID=1904413 RepID=UPI001B861CCC|nr:uncharacterized protein DEU56DRAFT_851000 [Suillus clintonianus]KAG2150462.1 hypothetical protein DEU56DRAFT_851000 [Suillus clintonianus]
MTLVVAEEEKQAHHLRSTLRSTGDRLDQEMRRAKQAESKTEFAELRVRELTVRVSAAETGKRYAELDAARANEEIRRHLMCIESLEKQVKQLQADVRVLERQRNEADDSASRARDTARKFQIELGKQQAKEKGIEENAIYGRKKWFVTGHNEGWDAGHAEGFDDGREDGFEEGRRYGIREGRELGFKQGRKMGRKEAFENGREQGWHEEHERAVRAFDEFFATEVDEKDYTVSIDPSHQYLAIETACFIFPSFLIMSFTQPLSSPGLASGRRRPKNLPSLPPSAFSPPSTGTSDMFPLPPTPSALFPGEVIDANVRYEAFSHGLDLVGTVATGVVLLKTNPSVSAGLPLAVQPSTSDVRVLSEAAPFELGGPIPSDYPEPSGIPQHLHTSYADAHEAPEARSQVIETLKWAFSNSRLIDIDVQSDVMSNAAKYEVFEGILVKATNDIPGDKKVPIVLSNILPPPHDLSVPIVKLLADPSYRNYQAHSASLSLFPNLYVKFTPPMWNQPVPGPGDPTSEMDQHREWKRKIKMFIGPVLEAFGYERIIFGTSPSFAIPSLPNPEDWFALVRESFAELAVEQEAIDAIFSLNAKRIYGP